MQILTLGKYTLLQDKSFRTSNSCFTLSKGCVIEVTQIDYKINKFYSETLGDWNHCEQPFEPVDKGEYDRLSEVYKLE